MMIQMLNDEILWVTYYCGKNVYYITSTKMRSVYHLWKDKNGNPVQSKHIAADPTELYKYCK